MNGTFLWLAVLLAILLFVDAIPSGFPSSTSSNLSPTRNEASPEEKNSKPNIIMILADDMVNIVKKYDTSWFISFKIFIQNQSKIKIISSFKVLYPKVKSFKRKTILNYF